MEQILHTQTRKNDLIRACSFALIGAAFLTACSFIRIPFYPVSFTMQTFAIAFLALTQRPKLAFSSVLLYLLAATCGLPVFGKAGSSFWFTTAVAGYYFAFPLAAYLVSKLKDKMPTLLALLLGQGVIYLLGMAVLAPFFGAKVAFLQGVVFFIAPDMLKNLAAMGAASLFKRLYS